MPVTISLSSLLVFALLFVVLLLKTSGVKFRMKKHATIFPPGPKRRPIIGNLNDMPSKDAWLVYRQWAKLYGDIIYLQVLGQPIVVLNSDEIASGLCDERATIYSDRPSSPMLSLMGWTSWNFGVMGYNGTEWKMSRRAFRRYFSPTAISNYESVQSNEAHRLLERLLDSPNDFMNHLEELSSTVIFNVVYGSEVIRSLDAVHFTTLAQNTLRNASEALIPERFWVDRLPLLRFLPEWTPGVQFRRKASICKRDTELIIQMPFNAVKKSMEHISTPSVVADMLENLPENADASDEDIVRNIAAAAHSAGFDTTAFTLEFFFLAMALYPQVQAKARKELDAIVGLDRLPTFRDREALVYINAIVKEVLRWRPIAPLGLAHQSSQDDMYKGYLIPKGSIVIVNTWSILTNPDTYPEPDIFKPERFIRDGELDPTVKDPSAAFGYGRRICPGQLFSLSTLFITVASVLHTYEIGAPYGEGKTSILSDANSLESNGFLLHPEPFHCEIKPRSAISDRLIRDLEGREGINDMIEGGDKFVHSNK